MKGVAATKLNHYKKASLDSIEYETKKTILPLTAYID
jgi:hypothetical protein